MKKSMTKKLSAILGASVVGGSVAVAAIAQSCGPTDNQDEDETYNRNTADYWLDTENENNSDVDLRGTRLTEFATLSIFLSDTLSRGLSIPAGADLATFSIGNLDFTNFTAFNQIIGIFPSITTQNVTLTNLPTTGPIASNSTLQGNVNDSFNYLNYLMSFGALAYSLIVEEEGWNSFFERDRRAPDPDESNYISERRVLVNNIVQILDNSRYIRNIDRYVTGDLGRMVLGIRESTGITQERGYLSEFLTHLLLLSQRENFNVETLPADIFAELLFPDPDDENAPPTAGSINEGTFLSFYRDFVNKLPRANTINFAGTLSINSPTVNPRVLAAGYSGLDNRTALSTYIMEAIRVPETPGDTNPDEAQTNIYLGMEKLQVIDPERNVIFLGLVG